MSSYRAERTEEMGKEQMNGNATYMIGQNKRREGFDLTKYWHDGSCRKSFPDEKRLESFLDRESLQFGITIRYAKGSSRRTLALLERLSRKYN